MTLITYAAQKEVFFPLLLNPTENFPGNFALQLVTNLLFGAVSPHASK